MQIWFPIDPNTASKDDLMDVLYRAGEGLFWHGTMDVGDGHIVLDPAQLVPRATIMHRIAMLWKAYDLAEEYRDAGRDS